MLVVGLRSVGSFCRSAAGLAGNIAFRGARGRKYAQRPLACRARRRNSVDELLTNFWHRRAMPAEILALMDKPLLLMAVLAVGAVLVAVERLTEGQKRAERRAYWQGRNKGKRGGRFTVVKGDAKTGPADAGAIATGQLACVMGAEFRARPLLNRPEAKLFKALDAAVIARNPGWQGDGAAIAGRVSRQSRQRSLSRGQCQARRLCSDGPRIPRDPRDRVSGHRPPPGHSGGPRRGKERGAAQGGNWLS